MRANEGPRKLGPTASLPSDMRPTSEPPSVCGEFAVKKLTVRSRSLHHPIKGVGKHGRRPF